jgi:hypothetical protein
MVAVRVFTERSGRRTVSVALITTALLLAMSACAQTRPGPPDGVAPAMSVGASDAANSPSAPPGDGPPNYADNNRWKQPTALSDADRRVAEDAADRIRPALAKLRAAGDFAPASTQHALLGLGFPATTVIVKPMRAPLAAPSSAAPVGVVYAVRVGAGCVTGDIRPERVLVQVSGVVAEFDGGCLEPDTH